MGQYCMGSTPRVSPGEVPGKGREARRRLDVEAETGTPPDNKTYGGRDGAAVELVEDLHQRGDGNDRGGPVALPRGTAARGHGRRQHVLPVDQLPADEGARRARR